MQRTIRFCALALVAAVPLARGARADAPAPGRVTFEATFAAPAVSEGADGLATVRLDGAEAVRLPGAPQLPARTVRLALPPDADLGSVRVTVTAERAAPIAGAFDVGPAPAARVLGSGRAVWGGAADRVVEGRDPSIYGTDAPYPASWGEAVGPGRELRGYKTIAVALHPVRYGPRSGRLVAAPTLRVEIRFRTEPARAAAPRSCRPDDALVAGLVDNFGEAAPWYASVCAAAGDDGVAVITTDELADAAEGSGAMLAAWKAMREAQGRTVTIATESDWDLTTGDPAEDGRADRIRKWLRDNLVPLELGWVMLVGNPDPGEGVIHSVPMKLCGFYTEGSGEEAVTTVAPTDFYYADLTSDFDQDGDGVYCEEADNVAFTPDVYVGRLPVYSDGPAAVDEMLARILAYEEESAAGDLAWRRRMMLPDSIYFYENQYGDTSYTRWDGATIGEWFIRTELRPRGMDWTTLYEREGCSPSHFPSDFGVNSQTVVDQWVRGYGFVYWAGHGSETGVYRTVWVADVNGNGYLDWGVEYSAPEFMTQSYTGMLVDAPPPFVVHGSCSNATPEYSENLAYNLLRRGAIATLAATRVAMTWHFPDVEPEIWEKPAAIQSDVSEMTADYAQRVLGGAEAGRAQGDMIAAVTGDPWGGSVTPYQISIQNLYGDPLVRLVMCRASADCDDGSFCDGVEICDDGSCQPGTPITCGPTDECAEMVCSDEAAACVPAASCVPDAGPVDTDTGVADAGPEVAGIDAATGMCSLAPRRAVTSLLSALL